mmetsp:Transcript_24459/g.35942  ORF Transcript_24459/g.35942 Transcript_24459/m.35942 type:complete len:101 (-) Transcript_24459:652-954(-)
MVAEPFCNHPMKEEHRSNETEFILREVEVELDSYSEQNEFGTRRCNVGGCLLRNLQDPKTARSSPYSIPRRAVRHASMKTMTFSRGVYMHQTERERERER